MKRIIMSVALLAALCLATDVNAQDNKTKACPNKTECVKNCNEKKDCPKADCKKQCPEKKADCKKQCPEKKADCKKQCPEKKADCKKQCPKK